MKFFSLYIFLLPAFVFAAPKIESIGLATPDVLYIDFTDESFEKGKLNLYKPKKDDKITEDDRFKLVRRKNELGVFVGHEKKYVRWVDSKSNLNLDRNLLDDKSNYKLVVNGHKASILGVFRKSTVSDRGRASQWSWTNSYRHQIFLKMDRLVSDGQLIKLKFPGFPQKHIRVDFNRIISPAIHLNQNGYHLKDKHRKAWLSLWMANGPDFGAVNFDKYFSNDSMKKEFHILNVKNEILATKPIKLRSVPNQISFVKSGDNQGLEVNKAGTYVYELDFSDVPLATGNYKIKIDGIGISHRFLVHETVWENAARIAYQGIYNSRSEIPRKQFDYVRPSTLPFNTNEFQQSTITLMETSRGAGYYNYKDIQKVDGTSPKVNGGYSENLDDGRHIQDLYGTWELLNLYEAFPKYFSKFRFKTPKLSSAPHFRGVNIPHLLNEAVYGLEFFRLLQNSEGGVRGGIEILVKKGEITPSWLQNAPVYAYAPDPWSSYIYSAVAARVALLLRSYNASLSEVYSATAEKAWTWAEKQLESPKKLPGKVRSGLGQARVWAAAEIFRLSNQEKYALIVKENIPCNQKRAELNDNFKRAGWAWMLAKSSDTELNELVEASLMMSTLPKYLDKVGVVKAYPSFNTSSNKTVPDLDWLSLLHCLTMKENPIIEKQLELGASFILGANQSDTCFTVGLGRKNPQNPFHPNSLILGYENVKGITVFGFADYESVQKNKNLFGSTWSELSEIERQKSIFPNCLQWPFLNPTSTILKSEPVMIQIWVARSQHSAFTLI